MVKLEKEVEVEKSRYQCADCGVEFFGKKCPQCGNDKVNIVLAPDGIDQKLHTKGVMWSVKDLSPASEITNPDNIMREEAARVQLEEMQNNMRDSYVMKSQIKKKELELEFMRKDAQLKEEKAVLEGPRQPPGSNGRGQVGQNYQDPYGINMGMPSSMPQSLFPPSNPQAAVMTHLMKMKKEERAEFLSSLADADPQAVSTLTSLVSPAPTYQPQMYPGMNIPPWMMPAYNQPQMQQQKDPFELAVSIINAVSELSGGNQPRPSGDSEVLQLYKEQLKEMREELKEMRLRPVNAVQSPDLRSVLDEISSLKTQMAGVRGGNDIVSKVKELASIITDLESAGLVQKPGSEGKTVDDEIRVKQFEHQVKMDEKRAAIDEQKLNTEKTRSEVAKGMLGAMFQRSLAKNTEKEDAGPKVQLIKPSVVGSSVRTSVQPSVVVEKFPVEGAVVYESRPSVKKIASEVL